MAAITTIVHFQLPPDNIDEFLVAWRDNHQLMVEQPGMLGGSLYRSTDPNGPFQFVNVARWESAEALKTALRRVAEEQVRRNIDTGAAFERLGVKIIPSNFSEELQY